MNDLNPVHGEIAVLRASIRGDWAVIVGRLEGATGLGLGPGAEKLLDELISAGGIDAARLMRLREMEVSVEVAQPDPNEVSEIAPPAYDADSRRGLITSSSMEELVDLVDTVPESLAAMSPRTWLQFGREDGAPHEVLRYLELIAEGARQGEDVVVFDGSGMDSIPAPGSTYESNGVKFVVIGFGATVGTFRARLCTEEELAALAEPGTLGENAEDFTFKDKEQADG